MGVPPPTSSLLSRLETPMQNFYEIPSLFILIKIWNESGYCLLAGSVRAFISITIIIFLRKKRENQSPQLQNPRVSCYFAASIVSCFICCIVYFWFIHLFKPLLPFTLPFLSLTFQPMTFLHQSFPIFPSPVFLLPFFHFLPLFNSLFPLSYYR